MLMRGHGLYVIGGAFVEQVAGDPRRPEVVAPDRRRHAYASDGCLQAAGDRRNPVHADRIRLRM